LALYLLLTGLYFLLKFILSPFTLSNFQSPILPRHLGGTLLYHPRRPLSIPFCCLILSFLPAGSASLSLGLLRPPCFTLPLSAQRELVYYLIPLLSTPFLKFFSLFLFLNIFNPFILYIIDYSF